MIRIGTNSDCNYVDEILVVTNIITSSEEDPVHDDTMGGSPLYELETVGG